jgi:hypothetical protein
LPTEASPVILQGCDPQSADAVLIERRLPGGELLGRECVALIRFLAADNTGAHGGDDGGLTTKHPSFRIRWRQTEDEVLLILVCDDGFV